jgi:hypothetical protein
MLEDFRKYLVFGSGVGIEIGPASLRVAVLKARPEGIQTLGEREIGRFRERPAAEWGMEYAEFLKQLGCGHLAAWVILPRHEVTVRQISLPGVSAGDLGSAIGFQLDALHPYGEDEEIASAWRRLGKTHHALVGIARRETVNRYAELFSEAGVKIASFTFSAAALYSALRVYGTPPRDFYLCQDREEGVEIYGESAARPVYSALLDAPPERARALAASELRLPPETDARSTLELIPNLPPGLPYWAALGGACPWLTFDINLLPEHLRSSTSRARYIPTMALAGILTLLIAALLIQPGFENRRYVAAVEKEIERLQPTAAKLKQFDAAITSMQKRVEQLDGFRLQTRQDMEALAEVTKIIGPPSWVSSLELSRVVIQLGGEADQAAGLLKLMDNSPLFSGSEFTIPLARMQSGEAFRIRANREGQAPK